MPVISTGHKNSGTEERIRVQAQLDASLLVHQVANLPDEIAAAIFGVTGAGLARADTAGIWLQLSDLFELRLGGDLGGTFYPLSIGEWIKRVNNKRYGWPL